MLRKFDGRLKAVGVDFSARNQRFIAGRLGMRGTFQHEVHEAAPVSRSGRVHIREQIAGFLRWRTRVSQRVNNGLPNNLASEVIELREVCIQRESRVVFATSDDFGHELAATILGGVHGASNAHFCAHPNPVKYLAVLVAERLLRLNWQRFAVLRRIRHAGKIRGQRRPRRCR